VVIVLSRSETNQFVTATIKRRAPRQQIAAVGQSATEMLARADAQI